jgi:hypothetical protein
MNDTTLSALASVARCRALVEVTSKPLAYGRDAEREAARRDSERLRLLPEDLIFIWSAQTRLHRRIRDVGQRRTSPTIRLPLYQVPRSSLLRLNNSPRPRLLSIRVFDVEVIYPRDITRALLFTRPYLNIDKCVLSGPGH